MNNIYQLKQFSDIKSANKFMNNHGGSTLVGYDRKTETTVTNEITELEIENADENSSFNTKHRNKEKNNDK